ncbi:MAG: L-threonylcarbamoyladenylate synthase [Gammaproteobacteria bacterium]|jgi:tRNA threonylcarbamoyl adenosine modification protein (Sua5/YciO/YrdC/YwlC family)|nr:threonylcarbamoyl-AMP synthase [Gammaproteobacteria bacterium]MDP6096642.1 L-threonylcarbamoyladenylate synthase [Gammaproteobacteria bacterium]MDP7455705.1 L-threonylcarbamoyladenylate synthase [Gammaproteobacteria bacterium]HJO12250.1 L-threonylcarbamoyladenylate synthase [Gammaproteobacteria bacterium]|tara:strand:- start:2666 stop:3286 length:621 start_codon:yes stop_codon:yes gene_type:complete
MSAFLQIHPVDPEPRIVKQAVRTLLQGGVIVYPTDSTYALGCHIGDKAALERIRRIRQLASKHNFTLVCSDLSSLASYAQVQNSAFRILKAYTPGPYTFILKATPEVPRRLMHPKRKTIGLRVPDNKVVQAILASLGEPIMSTSLILPDEEEQLFDPYEMRLKIGKLVDLIVDAGVCGLEPTTVVDLVAGVPELIRVGKGDPDPFQ